MLEINLFLKNGGSLQVTTDKHSKEEILNLYHITKVGILQLELQLLKIFLKYFTFENKFK